ncbi:MAG: hypothetical protein M3068_05080 [Gemmatimonadota bacterium]|nr:hypothetical protein [Gemmatimonadota bacterium]
MLLSDSAFHLARWRRAVATCRSVAVVILSMLVAAHAIAAQPRRRAKARAETPHQGEATPSQKMKGIWEPVSYPQDLALESVAFAGPEIGWAAGDAGTLIKTTDGGLHWTAQLGGDPQSRARRITDLQVLDETHAFAVQTAGVGDHTLMRTTDGEKWEASGTVPQHRASYFFTTPTVGVAAIKQRILRTQDAGRSWTPVASCALKAEVAGLARDLRCDFDAFAFPTPMVGYAIGHPAGAKALVVARTDDGGGSWTMWMALPGESGAEGHVFFTDENTGVACLSGAHLVSTTDGGKSWTGIAGVSCPGKPAVRFADREVGWALAHNGWNFTADGGRHWSSRQVAFPAAVHAFSLPRRDRGYVVGDHGMVYRYRIVPVAYSAPNSLDAPVVGAPTRPDGSP